MSIEESAKESILEWVRSAKLEVSNVTSALEQLGIQNIVTLKTVELNTFECVTKKKERFLLRLQANCKWARAWVDHNAERHYFLVQNGIIQRA